jgi:hypothetical protein
LKSVVDPCARAEVGIRVDHPCEHGIRAPEVLARGGIGDGRGGHVFSRRSVGTISITSATVNAAAGTGHESCTFSLQDWVRPKLAAIKVSGCHLILVICVVV